MLTLEQVLAATGGTLLCGGTRRYLRGVSIDSRTIRRGDIFIAIRGKRLDGHQFLRQAVKGGAGLVIISRKIPFPKDMAVIHVKDTTMALGQIAASYRERFDIPVVAITGSAGKTTTKDMIAAALATKFKVLKNAQTLNNQYGVALTVLGLRPSHEALVIELGTSHPGEIQWLTRIVQPTVAVLTNIGESHLAGLRSPQGVYQEKSAIFRKMDPQGHVIFNSDDSWLMKIPTEKRHPTIITYGIQHPADFRAQDITIQNNRKMCFHVQRHRFILDTPAGHGAYNALAAIACARLLRISYPDIQNALGAVRFKNRRQHILRSGAVTIIDDTYNSNPVSLCSALRTIDSLQTSGRKILVTADMLELGVQSRRLHEQEGRMIARSSVTVAITMGKLSRYAAQALRQANPHKEVFHCRSIHGIYGRLRHWCRPGDIVLVKGSRAMRMERVVEFLQRYFSKRR